MSTPKSWTNKKLDEVVTLQRGFDLPSSQRIDGPYPIVTAGGISGYHNEPKVHGPGFAIGRATNLGVPTWSDADFWPLNTTLYVKDFKGNDPRFLYHIFETLDLTGYDSGSVQPMLNRNYIAKVPLQIPPLPEQQAIAEVLGALDDKIAANRKLVATSLELVQALHDRIVLDEETTKALYTDVAEVGGGATPKTRVSEYWDGDIHWASPTDITALSAPYLHDTSRHITQAGLDSCSSPLYPVGSILMTSRATIGAFAVAQEPTAVNQGFIVLVPKTTELRWWLLHEMSGRVREFQNRANGATFLELSKRTFKTMEFDLPTDAQLRRFNDSASALHENAIAVGQESQTLADLRDTLLPALMDGTIRVKDAEKSAEEVL